MNKIFTQKRGYSFREFTLYSDKICIKTRTLRETNQWEVKLDNLGKNIQYKADGQLIGKILLYICLLFPIILLIIMLVVPKQYDLNTLLINTVIWWAFALGNYLKKGQDDIILTGGQTYLYFFRAVPNTDEVIKFINQVIEASDNYKKEKYTKDLNVSEDMFFARLNWLLEDEIINTEEYSYLKKKYSTNKMLP